MIPYFLFFLIFRILRNFFYSYYEEMELKLKGVYHEKIIEKIMEKL